MNPFTLGAKARAAGYRLEGFETIGSTNTAALDAARAGDPDRVWFAALQQTEGRGRRGRPWESPSGNLAASLLIVPAADPAHSATLGFVAGVALNRALAALVPNAAVRRGLDGVNGSIATGAGRIALKWPNDVLADGAKLAGILLEAQKIEYGAQAVVIGFGVNVVASPHGLPYPATCLADLGSTVAAEDVFEALSDCWTDCLAIWADGAGTPAILSEWKQAAAGIGAPVAVSLNGEIVRGIFETVDASGRLILREDKGQRIAITAGDVHFGAVASAQR